MLSTTVFNYIFEGFDFIFSYAEELNTLLIRTTYSNHISNCFSQNWEVSFYSLWYLSYGFSNSTILWSIMFDDLFLNNSIELGGLTTFLEQLGDVMSRNSMYVNFPDYVYLYKSFVIDLYDEWGSSIKMVVNFIYDHEDLLTIPSIYINFNMLMLYVYILGSVYFSYYGKANSYDKLIDHDYLLASTTVEAEEEITSFDDMILAVSVLSFTFLWYFGTNLVMATFHLPEYYLSLYVFPVIYYVIMFIPAFLAYDFGIYFVAYLRGKGDSTISLVELMYDYIAFASFYIRLIVQNVRLLLMTFTFASFHEIILIHEVNRSFLFGDESFIDAWMNDSISFASLCFSLVLQLSTHIVYYFYELLHLLFVVTAQIIAFHAMVFWLFLFLYTMFSAELHEKFFFQKRLQHRNVTSKYNNFKNSFTIK